MKETAVTRSRTTVRESERDRKRERSKKLDLLDSTERFSIKWKILRNQKSTQMTKERRSW